MTKREVLARVNLGELVDGPERLGIAVSELDIQAGLGSLATVSMKGVFVLPKEEEEEE